MKDNIHFFSQTAPIGNKVDFDKLGIRGRQANEFAELSLPVLPGIIIDSDIASKLDGTAAMAAMKPHFRKVEAIVKKRLDDPENPLLCKVVISPNLAISNYPTLHNFGLAKNTVAGFAKNVGDNFAAHEVLFLLRGMLKIEERIAEIEGKEEELGAIRKNLDVVKDALKVDQIKDKPLELLAKCEPLLPEGFFESAERQLAIALTRIGKMLHVDSQDCEDTALMIQPMVYGNYGKDSASGAYYTRNVVTGEKKLQGEYFQEKFNEIGATGKDINKIDPAYLKELEKTARKLEDHQKEIRQIRFTIEKKNVWLIEQRAVEAKSTQADIQTLLDLARRGVVTEEYAVGAIKPGQLNEILHPIIDIASTKALKASKGGIVGAPGAAIGRAYFSTEALLDAFKAAQQKGEDKRCILLMPSTFAEDVKAIEVATGVLSCEGGYSAHASVVARQYGKVSLVRPDMKIRGKKAALGEITINEGDYITMNIPYYGEPTIFLDKAQLIEPDPRESGLLDFIALTKKFVKDFHVRANSDSPRDANLALAFGAEGVGLCRTEHMFFNEKRINVFREMIVSDSLEERVKALAKLRAMQRDDFYGIFKAMAGKEVTIRLLDAPLHEFLPHNPAEMDAFMAHLAGGKKKASLSKAEVAARCDAISEFNPMLGHRGCRIAVTYPEIYEMQVRAIFEAVYQLQKEKVDVRPEIMIPIVMNDAELKLIVYGKKIEGKTYKGLIEVEEELRKELKGKKVDYKIGTMIELPVAALGAGEIAKYAEFFSFGTNDLTQTTIGISRDDFNSFMPDYTQFDILEGNPFSVLNGHVKELIEIAVRRGKLTRPNLVAGLCGEHGANPDNIRFCMDAGLNYVSCSPYSVPISMLAIAQYEIERAAAGK